MTELRPSLAQQEFIAKEIRHRRQVVIVRFMLLVLLLALWELAADFGWINSFIFSSPSMIAKCLLGMAADGSLFLHTGVTLLETVVSFALVVAVGLAVALMLWCSRSLSEILEPFLVMLNSLPKSALAPLLIVWLGNNMRTIIVAAISVALFGSILTLHTGLGKFLSACVMLIGYTIIAVPTGIVSASMMKEYKRRRDKECPNCHRSGHEDNAEFCKYCGHSLNPSETKAEEK